MAAVVVDSAPGRAGADAHTGTFGSAVAQAAALSRRAVLGIVRSPQVLFPSLAFPLLFAALNTAALGKAPAGIGINLFATAVRHGTTAPNLQLFSLARSGHISDAAKLLPAARAFHPFGPKDHYVDFLLVATLVQGVLFGSLGGASELASDIETGFFDRLVATPVWRSSILVGRLAGSAALGFVQGCFYLAVFLLFGAHIAGGLAGALVLPIAATLLALSVGGLASAMAIKTGSVEAVQGAFPLLFISIFLSSAFFPTALMKGWYKSVATHNPISWMIDGMREQVLYGFDAPAAAKAILIPAALTVVSVVLCLVTLRSRLSKS